MLPRSYRVPSFDIPHVIHDGKRVYSPEMHLHYLINNLSIPRLAIIIPLSVHKRAVVRNRIRRLVSESARLMLGEVRNIDGIIFVKKDFSILKQPDAGRLVRKLFGNAGVLK
jgi:ribonuclease P protein component